jgi:hypothetical protein
MDRKVKTLKIDWTALASVLNKRKIRPAPYSPAYLRSVYAGYAINRKVQEEIIKILAEEEM